MKISIDRRIPARVYAGYDEQTGGYQVEGDLIPLDVELDDGVVRIGALQPGMDSEAAGFYLTKVDALQLIARVASLLLEENEEPAAP